MGKRNFDFWMALISLAIVWPVLLTLFVLVRVNLGRPALFRQTRVGLAGQPFQIIKFRTMTDQRDASGALYPDNVRLTRFGRLLRSTSLDELPELYNVLRGDMSLVGPRPLLVEYQALYNERQASRHAVRPGLTGWAQINGRNGLDWPSRLEMDAWYVENQSFYLDIKIIWRTIAKVLRREGISAADSATMTPFRGNDSEK